MHCLTGRQNPRAFAADTMGDRFMLADAKLPQIDDPGPWATPLLPVTTTDAAADPLVQLAEEALDRHEVKVAHPALEISA